MEQVLTLQVEALAGGEPLGERERCRPAAERTAELVELGLELRIRPGLAPTRLELVQRRNQRLRDEAAAIFAIGPLTPLAAAGSSRAEPGSAAA